GYSSIHQVAIVYKVYLFEKDFYYKPGIFHDSIITRLRYIRNEGLHRCSVIVKDDIKILQEYEDLLERKKNSGNLPGKMDNEIENEGKLIPFLKEKNYGLVRNCVLDVAKIVHANLA
ncbi:MAG TPA: hypothetical protein VNX01_07280, partial [Bacteroidia bacterium]|nr:hypothetical protein [Bacteroidia bacterium]